MTKREPTLRQRVLNTVAAMVVAMPAVLTVGVGTAGAEGANFLSFTQIFGGATPAPTPYRADGIRPPDRARAQHRLRTDRRRAVATAIPNTPYDVRLIEMPRSSASSCNAGDPGVIAGVLTTDAAGAGSVTLRGPVASGATGAWMFISRPGEFAQTPAEFYTTDFVLLL